jgi:hypothetical protein
MDINAAHPSIFRHVPVPGKNGCRDGGTGPIGSRGAAVSR